MKKYTKPGNIVNVTMKEMGVVAKISSFFCVPIIPLAFLGGDFWSLSLLAVGATMMGFLIPGPRYWVNPFTLKRDLAQTSEMKKSLQADLKSVYNIEVTEEQAYRLLRKEKVDISSRYDVVQNLFLDRGTGQPILTTISTQTQLASPVAGSLTSGDSTGRREPTKVLPDKLFA
jgi:hypothetical protein